MRSFVLTLSLLSLVPLAACSSSKGEGGSDGTGTGEEGTVPMGAAAANLAITKVTINQGVDIAIYADGSDITNLNTGLVSDRHALIRVHTEPLMGWSPRDIQGVLTLEGEQGTATYEDIVSLVGPSTDGDLGSTFTFDIPGADLPGDQAISVALYEVDGASFDGDASQSAWPSAGSYAAPFQAVGPLRITLVPIQYDADGSGRLPDVSDAQLQIYEDLMLGMFPVPAVELTLADPFPWGASIAATGNGWTQLLMALVSYRSSIGLGNDEYLYGLMAPAANFGDFCGFGCVAGLSLLATQAGDPMGRTSMGLGFAGEEAALTMAHEVGHAHGREHAPCGLLGQPSDPGYPYAGAVLGVWGWDGVDGLLKDPNSYTDIMAYCMPSWLSDYTYEGLLQRSLAVNVAAMGDGPELLVWNTAWFDEHGLVAGSLSTQTLPRPPADAVSHRARFLGAAGEELGEARVYDYALSHLPGGLLMWPQAPAGARVVELEGYGQLELGAGG